MWLSQRSLYQISKEHHKKQTVTEGRDNKQRKIVPYVAPMLENLRGIFYENNISVHNTSSNTLKVWFIPRTKYPNAKLSNIVYAVQCSKECSDQYIRQRRRASTSD